MINEVEAVFQPFKFVGQYGVMAEPDGLYFMRARYYDPEVGRFIPEDPIGFGGGDVNLYAYVKNNSVNAVDPSGLFGLFGRPSGRVTAPAASLDIGGKIVVGSEGNGLRATLSGSAGGTALAGGAAIGRGFEAGFFTNDVSDFLNSNAVGIDTPLGGIAIYFDSNGKFQGIGVSGPSFGLGVTFTGPDTMSISKSVTYDVYNSDTYRGKNN